MLIQLASSLQSHHSFQTPHIYNKKWHYCDGRRMEEGAVMSKVLKVDSEEAWESSISQANNQGCPVFVHFTASWCVPSIAMNPCFEELATKYQHMMFVLVDVDELKGVASKMEVKAMPTFVLIKDGKVMDRMVGANPEEINKRIDAFLETHHQPNCD